MAACGNDPIKSRKKAGTNRTDSSLVDVYSQNVVIYGKIVSFFFSDTLARIMQFFQNSVHSVVIELFVRKT